MRSRRWALVLPSPFLEEESVPREWPRCRTFSLSVTVFPMGREVVLGKLGGSAGPSVGLSADSHLGGARLAGVAQWPEQASSTEHRGPGEELGPGWAAMAALLATHL